VITLTSRIDRVLDTARARLRRLEAQDVPTAVQRGAVLVDIRPQAQRDREGHVPAAFLIERNVLEWRCDPTSDAKLPQAVDDDVEWVVLCSEGYTSSLAAASLLDLGLHRATDVAGGYQALLAHGANPNLQATARPPGFGGTGTGGYNDAVGATPFVVAANAADVEMMRILLAAGADPHLVSKTNSNALLAATGLNRGIGEMIDDEDRALEAVTFLLDVGVDPKAVTTFNENALFGPGYRGWNRLLELLIEKGADVNVVSKAGVTPWLAASGFGDRLGGVLYNKAGADILLKHGADPKLGHPCQAQNRCRPE